MTDISEMKEIPEEEYSLYLSDKKEMSTMRSSDDVYAARFRHEMKEAGNKPSNYFGYVKKPEVSYVPSFLKGVGRAAIAFIPTAKREISRIVAEKVIGSYANTLNKMNVDNINFQIQHLEKRKGVADMTLEQRKDFYKNDPEYNALFNQLMGKYDDIITFEDGSFNDAVNETFGEIKKQNEQWISSWGLDKNENDSAFMYELGNGATSLLGAVGLTVVTKNPTAAATAFGIGQTASVYEELREKGVDPDTAILYAMPAGIAEGALEKFGLQQFIENIATKTIMKSVVKNIATEAIQEGSQQTFEEVLLLKYRPEEVQEKLQRIGMAMVYGGILGGVGSIASRPFVAQHKNDVQSTLINKYGVDEVHAGRLASDAVIGNKDQQDAATKEIQKIIATKEFEADGFDTKTAEALAETMANSNDDIKKEILAAANAELDPETFEGGSIESSVKFFDKELEKIDLVSQDFDIKAKVKETALANGVNEEEAELAGTLSESFARVISNITHESPREQWENGGELIIEDLRTPSISELKPVAEEGVTDENGITYYADGTYDDGKHIYREDGTILFQGAINTLIAKSKEQGSFKDSVKIGKVPQWLSDEAMKHGLNIQGYEHAIDVSAIKHIKNIHGDEKKERSRGQVAITDNDIQMVPLIVGNPDYIVFGAKNRQNNEAIVYVKKMNDGSVIFVEEMRTKRKTLSANTMWKMKSDVTSQSLLSIIKQHLRSDNVSIDILSHPNNNVNTLYQSAFAGSRVDYGQPSLKAIGTGEGVQVHGWGLYYALSKDTAESYRRAFLGTQSSSLRIQNKSIGDFLNGLDGFIGYYDGALLLLENNPDMNPREYFIKALNEYISDFKKNYQRTNFDEYKKAYEKAEIIKAQAEKLADSDFTIKQWGQVHEVDIPENPYLLDEQKYIGEQSDIVKKGIRNTLKRLKGLAESGAYPDYKKALTALDYEYADIKNRIDDPDFYENKTGYQIYDIIEQIMGSPKEASWFLLENGIKGITYEGKRDGRCFVIFNPDDVKVIQKFYQNAQSPRGYIKMGEMQKIIRLLQNADPSTIVHELGHYFTMRYLDVLNKAGRQEEAAGVLEWLGVKSLYELSEEHWEKFARGFETYVMEGQSPNAKMTGIFTRFKQWLSQVYTDLISGKIIAPEEINDDVRSFFDKMLATEEEASVDIESIKEKVSALQDVIKSAMEGKEVSVDGITLDEVNDLLKVINQRIPRKPKNLTQLLREVGINMDFAKIMDIREAMGLQDSVGGASGLFVKNGGIDREDALVEFLKTNGFIFGDSKTYEDVSNLWEQAINALENADNLYRQEDLPLLAKREEIMEAVNLAAQVLAGIDYDKVVKAVSYLRSKNITAVQKDTLKYIKSKLKSIDSDYKKIIKNLLRTQKNELNERRNELIDFVKGQPLSGDSKVKLLTQIKKASSPATFYKIAQTIQRKAIEYYAKERWKLLDKQIQSELKATRPTKVQNQRYDYETNKLFLDLRAYNKMTQIQAEATAKDLFAGLLPEDLEIDDEANKIRRRFLAYKSKGSDSSYELLQAVYDDIVRMKELGRIAKDDAHMVEMINRENDRQEIIQKLDVSHADADSLKTKAMNVYRRGFTNLYSLLNSMFGKEIADKYEFETKQTDSETKIYLKTRGAIEQGQKVFEVKNESALLDLFADMSTQKMQLIDEQDGLMHEVDRFQIMDIYNAIKNEKTKADYYRSFGEEQINDLLNTLSVKERLFADYLMDEVNKYYDAMNKVYIQLYDIDLPKVPNYWPATSEHKEAIDIQGDYYNQSTTPSAFKERTAGKKIPIPKSAWEKFGKHIAEAEYITGMGLDYMNIKRTFKSRRVKHKILEHFGEGVYRNLMDDIEALSINNRLAVVDDVSGLFQKMLNNWVVAKISFNPTVFFNQLTSITNYAENMPVAQWTKYFIEGLANPKKTAKYVIEQAPFLKARYGTGYNEALSRAISEANRFGKKKGKWNEALTSWTRTGDLGAIIFGGYPYLRYLQENGDKEAVRKFEFATLRSQQSGTAASLSPYQRNKSGMMRFFLAFKNTPQQYLRKMVDANVMLANGDIDLTQYSKTMFNYGVVQPMFYILMGNFIRSLIYFNDDDEEDKSIFDGLIKQIFINPFESMPLVSDMAGATYDVLTEGKIPYKVIRYPMFDDLERAAKKVGKKEKDFFDYAAIVAPLIEALTAAPVQTGLRLVEKNFYK